MLESQEVEEKLNRLFKTLEQKFNKLDRLESSEDKRALLDEAQDGIAECKKLLREFEREARLEDMAPEILSQRKAGLVKEIQTFVGLKKLATSQLNRIRSQPSSSSGANPFDVESGAGGSAIDNSVNPMRGKNLTNNELIQKGRKMMDETDDSLMRSVRVLEQTKQVGIDTAAALQEQTATAERIVNKLDEIEFTLKKSGMLIRHLTRSVATDKCFQFLIGLIGVGVIVIVILNVMGKDKGAVQLPGEEGASPAAADARRFLQTHYFL
ncbi:vesicle transport v-SNARE protein [Chloropicon primus]|uniref:Vesicle transport v-SNARE protein n=1 Tax=Chloropicon primus TaxID=1764295 RepID=A0A5B8MIK2_9CHLO|nr:vesicle transport v-SNARE protein [Chloropicon primus]UPQ99333.1 vesicle transport v-SNARE protein [Chloropicon primus]|eukprot:QDZ20121.1 vesicle transport v-SNARE protein [Chloropicon primus]